MILIVVKEPLWKSSIMLPRVVSKSRTENLATSIHSRRQQQFNIMDYEGQKLAELLFYWIICSFGAVGWVIGYIHQDFTLVFYAWLVGVGISVVSQFPYCSRYEIQ